MSATAAGAPGCAVWTQHASERFATRFPGVDRDLEWASALTSSGRVGEQRKRQIRAQCPHHAHEVTRNFRRFYYRLGRSGCVFVVVPPVTIITVFPLQLPNAEALPPGGKGAQ